MNKYTIFIMAVLCVILLRCGNVKADGCNVLLVYDTKQQEEELTRLITACDKTVDAVKDSDYQQGMAVSYHYIVTTTQTPIADAAQAHVIPVCVGEAFSSTSTIKLTVKNNVKLSVQYGNYTQPSTFQPQAVIISSYDGIPIGIVTTGSGEQTPFAVFSQDRISVPYVGTGDVSSIAFGAVLQRYFDSSEDGNMYVLIDEIYPFSDLNQLCATADLMHDNAIPFILRIMPVYDNLDYPAFLRYAQVLRYVQSRGGTIVLHDAIVKEDEIDREPLEDKLDRFYTALAEQDIDWRPMQFPPYAITLDAIAQITSGSKNFGSLPINAMITMQLPKDQQELDNDMKTLNSKWFSIQDYKYKFTSENYRYDETAIDDQYTYIQEQAVSFGSFFSAGNRLLLVIVSVSLVIFIILIALGYSLNRRKFGRGGRT